MEKKYYSTIGLEVHAELKTESKMFCACKNDPDETEPNKNVCPVCLAHPGTLPVPNKKAIENVIKVGLAIGGEIADFSEFDRKNYFYPDIPKGYQISQYKYPIVKGGELAGMKITRVHLEEDTGTSKHDKGNYSIVDFNRAGVPLMELVTDPHTFDTPEEASKAALKFAKELQLVYSYLDVSGANMEKGEFRVEANISISPEKGVLNNNRVEVKNLNSFRSVERAVLFELARMQELFEQGRENEIIQETRGWDENKMSTYSQRTKENAEDYRYFPDPDIPKFRLHKMFDIEDIRRNLAELPEAKRSRYKSDFGIKDEDIDTYINDKSLGSYFEEIAKHLDGKKDYIETASNFITSDLLGILSKDTNAKMPSSLDFAKLISMFKDNKLSSRATKDILAIMVLDGGDPEAIANEKGMIQTNDEGALKVIVQKIVALNEKIVADYKSGKEAALQGLVGQVMKETKGSANPQVALKLIKDELR